MTAAIRVTTKIVAEVDAVEGVAMMIMVAEDVGTTTAGMGEADGTTIVMTVVVAAVVDMAEDETMTAVDVIMTGGTELWPSLS